MLRSTEWKVCEDRVYVYALAEKVHEERSKDPVEYGIVRGKFIGFDSRDMADIKVMILAHNGRLMYLKDCFRIYEHLIIKIKKIITQREINPIKRKFD